MKKLIFALGIVLVLGFLVRNEILTTVKAAPEYIKTHKNPLSDPLCLQFKVTFKADADWKENGRNRFIMAGCDGQGSWKRNRPGCTGGLVKIHPGETAILGRCSCFNIDGRTNQEGCLKIGKKLTIEDQKTGYRKRRNVTVEVPLQNTDQCTFKVTNKKGKVLTPNNDNEYVCGINEQKKEVNVKVKCREQECPKPGNVAGVKVTCPNCEEEGSTSRSVNNNSAQCGSSNPSIAVVGQSNKTGSAGQEVTYTVKATNNDKSGCTSRTFVLLMDFDQLPAGWDWNKSSEEFTLGAGESKDLSAGLISPTSADTGESAQTTLSVYEGGFEEKTSNEVTIKYTVQ